MRKCDGCHKESNSIEQSSCLTAECNSNMEQFGYKDICPDDYFYCKDCMSRIGFCKDCAKKVPIKIQLKVFRGLKK